MTYIDETAPVLSNYPESLVLMCGEALPEIPAVSATDNCSSDVEVSYTETGVASDPCAPVERTWCASDCSGNETCHTQLIFFEQPQAAPALNEPEMNTWQVALDRLAVQFTANDRGRWGVDAFDMNGRRVANLFVGDLNAGEARRIEVDAQALVSGIYIIQFTNGASTVTRRLSIVR